MVDYLPLKALSSGVKNTFWAICSFAYGNRVGCYPSQGAVALRAGCSRVTVNIHARRLASLGLLVLIRKGRGYYYLLPHKVHGQRWTESIAKQVAGLSLEVHEYKTLKQFLAEERAKPRFAARELRKVQQDIKTWGKVL